MEAPSLARIIDGRERADAVIRYGNRSAEPEKRCSGSSSSERPARPFRLAGLSLACPAFFVRHDGLLRIVSYANGRIGSGAA